MSLRVVISQPMYFPWVGLFEQIRLADIFVHYDDAQFSKGSFVNRVQVKTPHGPKWMTIPLRDHHFGQCIDEVLINDRIDWRAQHINILRDAYFKSPFFEDMMCLVGRVLSKPATTLAEVSRASLMELVDYFDLRDRTQFVDSKVLRVEGASSQRVRDIVLTLGGKIYITGHGARNYLNHAIFEQSGIAVEYMQYRCLAYPQLHGEFTPYVTALDLVANCGPKGVRVIQSETVDWKEFLEINDGTS